MAKRIVINDDIPSISVPWDDGIQAYSGQSIERFIKRQLSSKIGYPIIPKDKDADGFYQLWGFADYDAYLDYISDPDTNGGLLLMNVAIPIMEEHGAVSNIVTLTRNSAASIVTSKPVASVEVAYLWRQFNPVTQETTEQDEDATVTVSCRTQTPNGSWGPWDAGKEFSVNIQSGQTKTIDLSGLLTSDATYQVRLVATGELSGISASPVNVTIVYSNVSSRYEGSIATAYRGDSIQLPFRISGGVQKQLRIKVNGYTKNYSLGTDTFTDNTYGAVLTQSEFGLTRGAVRAEAWIAFGEGYSAETEHQEFQFIYIPEGDSLTTPILAVTDITEEFNNWTRATIFRYAIYNPANDTTPLRLVLQDRDTGQVYIRRDSVCKNGESYAFDENFSMECDGDEQPDVIHAQAVFTNQYGLTYGNNINFTVDNSENFAPTKGADLVLSPENRSVMIDGTTYALEGMLRDPNDTNSGWKANDDTDSQGKPVSVPVLSIGAGNRLNIPYELFDDNTGHNVGGSEGSITVEFDIKVQNIVGDSPIIDASVPFSDAYTGMKFYPTRAVCLSRNNFTEDICDLKYREEVREHIAINIIRNLRGEGINLVRLYINGISDREFIYTDEDAFVPIGAKGAQEIVIGSDEADVDIYGIRVYKGQQLGSSQIQNDYMAGMPTLEDKKLFKRFCSIFNGTEISYDLCNAMGLNTILRRIPNGGHYPSRENQSKQKGVAVDVRIYGERGNPDSIDLKHSGTFTGMTVKGQGTSAKGYYWWNESDGFEADLEITAAEYAADDPTMYARDGRYFRKISYFNSLDGTSQVYASEYEIEDGRGGITKLVGKANYASPMQSHKLGAVWAYDELWQILVNNGSDGRPVLKDTHACCYEKPFLTFYQIGEGSPVFCGFQTWGSGKGDKKTFGYDKKRSPGYLCVSGADNGSIAALYQMPWIVSRNADGAWEGNIYPKSVTINTGDIKNGYCYKAGASDTLSFEVEIGSKYDGGETDRGVLRIEDEAKGATEDTLYTHFADFANFVFACSPFLKPYAGSEAQLIADSDKLVRDHQYWLFNTGADRYSVYYYNPGSAKFEKAVRIPTAWGENNRASAYGSPTLIEQLAGTVISVDTVEGRRRVTLEEAMDTLGTSDMDVLNECFIKARVAYFAAHASAYIDITDVVFHQAYCKFDACTDNRTKNVYPWIDPSIDLLVRLKGDDFDTTKATDNQGRQTKPYHVLEHDKDANGNNYWNGENNVLFTLVERAFADRIRNMMRDMFAAMAQICGSVDGYLQQRFYWVQEYFPAVAYNETTRLLYEVAQVKMMKGELDVSQDPITQAIGDQLECEKQFMNQRLPMLMSWCEYETGGDGTLSFRSVNDSQGQSPTYDIEYTAYQYIYPKLAIGGSMAALYAMKDGKWVNQGSEPYRCAPGETVRLVVNTDSNTQFTMRWMHYAKSIGNLGSLPCGEDGNVTVTGRRLRRLECSAGEGQPIEFHPKGLAISNCRNLEEVDFTNASAFSGTFSADLPRLKTLRLAGSSYTGVTFPKTSTLTEVALPSTVNAITVDGQRNLSSLTVAGMDNLRALRIAGEHKLQRQTQSLVMSAYSKGGNVNSVHVDNVAWTGFPIDAMRWLVSVDAHLTGNIALTGDVSLSDKAALVSLYGNIDDADNPLYVSYARRTVSSIAVSGPSYIAETGTYRYGFTCIPASGNDVAVKDGRLAVEWSIEDDASAFGSFVSPDDGVFKVHRTDERDSGMKYAVSLSVTKMNGSVLTADFAVGFYRRTPMIGDFAYADGTFYDQFVKEKTCIGLVYKIDEMWQGDGESEPTVFTGYDKPTADFKATIRLVGYQVLIDSINKLYYRSADGLVNASVIRWGLLPQENGSYEAQIRSATGLSDAFDLQTLPNVDNCGFSGGTQTDRLTSVNYLDANTIDGFKDYSGSTQAAGDWNGKRNTLFIVNHARRIITGCLFSESNETINTRFVDDGGVEWVFDELPSTIEELSNDMMILQRANNNNAAFQNWFYPAAYGCFLYEPKIGPDETLDEQYTSGNWFLPSAGELFRQFSFYAKSRTGGLGETDSVGANTKVNVSVIERMISEALNAEVSNEIKENVSPSHLDSNDYTVSEVIAINRFFHSLPDAEKPIYSMSIWRAMIASAGGSLPERTSDACWSSTERHSAVSWNISFATSESRFYWHFNRNQSYAVYPSVAYRFFF